MKRLSFLFLILLFIENIYAIDIPPEAKNILKAIHESTKGQRLELSPTEDFSFGIPGCIDCPNLTRTATQVNEILLKLVEKPEYRNKVGLLEKVESLEAKTLITQDSHNRGDCLIRRLDYSINSDDPRKEQLLLVFKDDLDTSKLSSMHLRDGQIRDYYYRGKGEDRDIVVRVRKEGNKAEVYYYRLKGSWRVSNTKAYNTQSNNSNEESENIPAPENYFNGPDIEMDGYLPKKIVLISAGTKTQIDGVGRISTKTTITTDEQSFRLGLQGNEGRSYMDLAIYANGRSVVQVPYDFTIEGIPIESLFEAEVEANGSLKVGYIQNYKFEDPSKNLSIGFTSDSGETDVFFRFKKTF